MISSKEKRFENGWYVKITEENSTILRIWFNVNGSTWDKMNNPTMENAYYLTYEGFLYKSRTHIYPFEKEKITTEEFKKYILNEK